MKKYFDRDVTALEDVFEFLNNFVNRYKINSDDAFAIQLVTEELFTNLVKYNQDEKDKIVIELNKVEQKLVLTFIDSTDQPFNLHNAKPYDTTQKLEERPIGKIGIHLIHTYMDEVEQEYKNKKSTIRLIKNLRQ